MRQLELPNPRFRFGDLIQKLRLRDPRDHLIFGDRVTDLGQNLDDLSGSHRDHVADSATLDQDPMAVNFRRHRAKDAPKHSDTDQTPERDKRDPRFGRGDLHELIELLGGREPVDGRLSVDLALHQIVSPVSAAIENEASASAEVGSAPDSNASWASDTAVRSSACT